MTHGKEQGTKTGGREEQGTKTGGREVWRRQVDVRYVYL